MLLIGKISNTLNIHPNLLYDDYLKFIASGYGNNIKIIRKGLNLTQKEFGCIIKVHRKTITRWKKEESYPKRDNHLRLMEVKACNTTDDNFKPLKFRFKGSLLNLINLIKKDRF